MEPKPEAPPLGVYLLAGLYQLNAAGSGAHALFAPYGVDFHDTVRKPNQDRAEGAQPSAICSSVTEAKASTLPGMETVSSA